MSQLTAEVYDHEFFFFDIFDSHLKKQNTHKLTIKTISALLKLHLSSFKVNKEHIPYILYMAKSYFVGSSHMFLYALVR